MVILYHSTLRFTDIPANSQVLLWQSNPHTYEANSIHHRTVIVTAGVHQGLAERLAPPGLTF